MKSMKTARRIDANEDGFHRRKSQSDAREVTAEGERLCQQFWQGEMKIRPNHKETAVPGRSTFAWRMKWLSICGSECFS
jgi:hypothetical protein